ncbi:MAG TPA: hypothetical protein VI142_07435 [Gaiellaceae bacterium]
MSFWRFLTGLGLICAVMPIAFLGVWAATHPGGGNSDWGPSLGGWMLIFGLAGFVAGAVLAALIWVVGAVIEWLAGVVSGHRSG